MPSRLDETLRPLAVSSRQTNRLPASPAQPALSFPRLSPGTPALLAFQARPSPALPGPGPSRPPDYLLNQNVVLP